jgi:catechol 2,3-dioxygenase-like lactoylglutathione lyase family enzyme
MLGGSMLYANLKAPDLDVALEFYTGKLGLFVLWDGEIMPGHREVLFSTAGGVVCIEEGEPVQGQARPRASPSQTSSRQSQSYGTVASPSKSTTFRASRPRRASRPSGISRQRGSRIPEATCSRSCPTW